VTNHHRAPSRWAAFRYAFAGLWHVLCSQRNAWIHVIATFSAIGMGAWLRISRLEWAAVLIVIGLVWMAEFLNTALEAVVDLASPDLHPLARVGKDVGAAAVLIAAVTAAVIGILVFAPPLLARFP